MSSLFKVFPLHCCDTGLLSCGIHGLELGNGILPDVALDQVDSLAITGDVWPMAFQPNHVKGCSSFKRTMDMVVLAGILGFVQISREPPIEDRLSLQEIGVW